MKLGEVVVIHEYYNFTKFHQNQKKNKKVLLIARLSVQNFKVSVELWKSYIVYSVDIGVDAGVDIRYSIGEACCWFFKTSLLFLLICSTQPSPSRRLKGSFVVFGTMNAFFTCWKKTPNPSTRIVNLLSCPLHEILAIFYKHQFL